MQLLAREPRARVCEKGPLRRRARIEGGFSAFISQIYVMTCNMMLTYHCETTKKKQAWEREHKIAQCFRGAKNEKI